jgi:chromosome partitioning protein
MEIYAIANQKGGVGKTTVTLGLAGELARREARTLLLDLDPQASATKVLGIGVEERPTVADAMLEPDRFAIDDAVVTTGWGFDLAPAETALASRESRRAAGDEFVLRRQLERVDRYEAILVDCPPSLGLLTLNALVAASRLVVVTEPSFLALQGLKELLETYELVREHYNRELVLVGVIVNRWDRTVEQRRSTAEIERYFGDGVAWKPYVPKRTVLQDAARHGVPVHRSIGHNARDVARAFAELAGRLEASHGAR